LVTFFEFSVGALSLFSLSHTLGDLEFSRNTLGGYDILGFLEKEGKGREGKCKRSSRSETTSDFLAGTKFHVFFFTSFGMHGICTKILGHDLSLTWRISWIDSGFHILSIS